MADAPPSDNFDAAIEISNLMVEDGNYAGQMVAGPLPDLDCAPLIKYLGIEDLDAKGLQQIQNIWAYFSKDTTTPGAIVKAISDTENRLASPNVGDNRLSKLHNYVSLLIEAEDVDMERKAYLKRGKK